MQFWRDGEPDKAINEPTVQKRISKWREGKCQAQGQSRTTNHSPLQAGGPAEERLGAVEEKEVSREGRGSGLCSLAREQYCSKNPLGTVSGGE